MATALIKKTNQALLFVWFSAPYKKSWFGRRKPTFSGGHVALQVDRTDRSAYLGWWPTHYDIRPGRKRYSRWEKLNRFRREYDGRMTRCASIADMTDPKIAADDIDSVLVPGKIVDHDQTDPRLWKERKPDRVFQFSLSNAEANEAIEFIETFQANQQTAPVKYQAITNNCATLCVKALQAAGVPLPDQSIWSPRLLHKKCRKLVRSHPHLVTSDSGTK